MAFAAVAALLNGVPARGSDGGLAGLPGLSIAPQQHCQAKDPRETGLQGQVPVVDRYSGRASLGYRCNLAQLSQVQDHGSAAGAIENGCCTLDYYRDRSRHDCVYYQDSLPGYQPSGAPVIDVSDPRHPVQTAYLDTPAMRAVGEGLRVNARRGLLVADAYNGSWLDVYDISEDCRHPRLSSSEPMPHAQGHEGCFAPDGRIFYMGGSVNTPYAPYQPIDLTNPRKPRELGGLDQLVGMHGCSISDDGRTGYFCQQENGSAIWTVDLSDFQLRRAKPRARTISVMPLTDVTWCQSTYPVTYGKHPYLIRYGESSPIAVQKCLAGATTNFDHPHIIDLANPRRPRIVSSLALQVDDPGNCPLVLGDKNLSTDTNPSGQLLSSIFVYDDHHCSPDRLHNPTILACSQFMAGLRVYDIRDPAHPRELAYFNPGTLSLADPTVDMAGSRPVVLADRGEILYTSFWGGLHVLAFEGRTWPFPGYGCPPRYDYYFAQYNPNSVCRAR